MNYLSVCSGIEAATVAWEPLGFKPLGFSEIEEFPCEVLRHHYPEVKNFGDMTQFQGWNINEAIDILAGGTPCQSFSIAGLRKGLDDPRGNLCLTYIAIAAKFKPRWIVWENVPGVLSSNGGRDFGSFLGALEKCGYGWSYRVLDAQWFGVAQRRRRVFVVANLGSWQRSAAVLFERKSLQRNPAPSREAWKRIAATITKGAGKRGDWQEELANCIQTTCNDYSRADGFNMVLEDQVGSVINVRTDGTVGTLRRETHGHEPAVVAYGIPGNWIGRKPENGGNAVEPMNDLAPCLTKTDKHGVVKVYPISTQNALGRENGKEDWLVQPIAEYYSHDYCQDRVYSTEGLSPALNCSQHHTFRTSMAVRRLTPVECERLQGFPDNYTLISYRNKPAEQCPDSPRYKALGNSMAVPVMRWIGERIAMVEAIAKNG